MNFVILFCDGVPLKIAKGYSTIKSYNEQADTK